MNHKVILAEDSLTIQKVIKHIFEKQPFDVVDCASEAQLFERLEEIRPSLVLLDFNLSSTYTGYELTSKIRVQVPGAKVVLLLGTFDVVDDSAMAKAGAADKVVKPFDSNKLIAICKRLVDDAGVSDSPWSPASSDVAEEEDQWTMSNSAPIKNSDSKQSETKLATEAVDPLLKEVSDWGMSIPGVINDKKHLSTPMDLPPVIGEAAVKPLAAPEPAKDRTKERILFPVQDDLDYPDLAKPVPENKESRKAPSFIPTSDLKEKSLELELEGPVSSQETDVKQLEDLIRDEVEEDLWKADEFEDLKAEVSSKIEEVQHFQPSRSAFDESLFHPFEDEEREEHSSSAPRSQKTSSEDAFAELRSEMEVMVKRYVQEYLDEMFKQKVEKVSWEVIPDLAENLIRQELGKIASKVLEEG